MMAQKSSITLDLPREKELRAEVARPACCTNAPSETSHSAIRDHFRRPGVLPLLLGAFSSLLYCGTVAFNFLHYDDRKQIVENAAIKAWAFLPKYFTGNVWALIDPHKPANYYRPLFLLWLKVNYSLFGLSPLGWHAMNVLLQALITVQVFWLARRLLRAEVPAAVSALLFAVHPVHVESVAWISGVTDLLVAACMLAATLLFLRSIESFNRIKWSLYAASLAFAALALLSKETAVVLPLLLMLSAAASTDDHDRLRIWKYGIPFFAIALIYFVVRQIALRGLFHSSQGHTAYEFALTLPLVFLFYVKQFFAPLWISPFADVYWVNTPNLQRFWIPVGLCGLLLIAAISAYRFCSNRPILRALYAWALLPLLPALYISIFPASELVHDRYLYVPSIGLCILTTLGGWQLARKIPQAAVRSATVLTLAGLAFLTFEGEFRWGSELLLFKYAADIAPNNDAALLNLGVAYIARNHPEEGIAALTAALERNPNCALAAYDIGHYLVEHNRYPEAERMLARAVTLDPFADDWRVRFAEVELRLGKIPQAEQAVRDAIQMRPDGVGSHLTLGAVLLAKGDGSGAEQAFAEELRLHPESETAREALRLLRNSDREPAAGDRRSSTD